MIRKAILLSPGPSLLADVGVAERAGNRAFLETLRAPRRSLARWARKR